MPNCFALKRKSAPEAGFVGLSQIDEEICKKFQVEVHPVKYYHWWYDNIGFSLACGQSFDDIKARIRGDMEKYKNEPQEELDYMQRDLEITEFLDENFVSSAWAEIGRGR